MKTFHTCVVLLVLLGTTGRHALLAAEAIGASSILQKVVATYAAASTYQDSGVILTHDPAKERPDELQFQTLFVRPDQLRFAFLRRHPYPALRHKTTSTTIRPDGNGSHLISTGRGEPKPLTLSEACGAAAGVSRGASVNIPRLLTSTDPGYSLADLTDLKRLGDETFEGAHCHRIEGTSPRGAKYEIFVGQADFLIRRILTQLPGSAPAEVTEEIHRDIRINEEVSAATLMGDR